MRTHLPVLRPIVLAVALPLAVIALLRVLGPAGPAPAAAAAPAPPETRPIPEQDRRGHDDRGEPREAATLR
jgi:hypothetical protein